MDIRAAITLVEDACVEAKKASGDEARLEYALWWVQRWVSGSMRDPDWDWPEAEAMGLDAAFAYLHQTIGNKLSIGKPLWRFLKVSGLMATKIASTKAISPHKFGFQSFTTDRRIAYEFGEEDGRSGIIVCVEPPPQDVMFGMADLRKDKRTGGWLLALEDWHHQDEVVVRVNSPLQVLTVERVKF